MGAGLYASKHGDELFAYGPVGNGGDSSKEGRGAQS